MVINIDINESEIQKYANDRIKQAINQRIKEEVYDFKLDSMIEEVIDRKVTNDVINHVIKEIDIKYLTEKIAFRITEELSYLIKQ